MPPGAQGASTPPGATHALAGRSPAQALPRRRRRRTFRQGGRMLREFKDFISRGNVVGLAVAVVVGAAFGVVVSSFVNDILMQLVAAAGAKPSFNGLSFTLNGAEIRYGAFLNALVMFLIVSAAMFLVVKAYQRLVPPEKKPAAESEVDLLRQIRDALQQRRREA